MAEKMDAKLDYAHQAVEEKIDTDRKLRVGIIGCGWIAGSHIDCYKRMPDVEVVAGCDLIPGKAAKFFRDNGVAGVKTDYASHKEMLDDESLHLDAVSVCTYNRQHAIPTIYALKKGVNVLLEKPFTVTLDEAIEVMKAEKESGKVLSIGFQPRLDANMQMIKKIVESGELGQVYYIQTGGGRRRGIPTPFGTSFIEDSTAGLGALADIGCYSLDMVLNAVGYPKPLTVTGYKSDFFGKDPATYPDHPEYAKLFGVDDFAAAFIRLEGGIILDFRIAWAMNINTPAIPLFWVQKRDSVSRPRIAGTVPSAVRCGFTRPSAVWIWNMRYRSFRITAICLKRRSALSWMLSSTADPHRFRPVRSSITRQFLTVLQDLHVPARK